jgi:hypothetical protein
VTRISEATSIGDGRLLHLDREIPMGMKTRILTAVLIVAMAVSGCSWSKKEKPKPQFPPGQGDIRLIAVMPVLNQTKEPEVPRLLRQKLFDQLYFKGYPKIPLEVIDGKLNEAFKGEPDHFRSNASPQMVGRLLGADAALYVTLFEASVNSSMGVYAPVTVSALFELKNTRSGEILWSSSQKTVMRQYDITKQWLEWKTRIVFEDALNDVVQKALVTLPDGPNALG